MSEQQEYIVTLNNKDDLDEFYYDMETPGGNLYIPDRSVDIINRRPISRNTHYNLTAAEAEQIKQDPRVLDIELIPELRNAIPGLTYTDTSSYWDKSSSANALHKNWGLLRCYEGQTRSNWGSNGTSTVGGTVNTGSLDGTGVDVVIVDGLFDPAHPEFAVNADGTGGTRVVQYNWTGYQGGTYNYGSYTGSDPRHGCHVAGTVAGNTQGWARKAAIYNINFSGAGTTLMDHIRQWHNNKGNSRPTVVNNSWAYTYTLVYSLISSIVYRGTTYNGPFDQNSSALANYGITRTSTTNDSGAYTLTSVPAIITGVQTDYADAIADGIIVVGSAGNSNYKIDINGGTDYNNYILYSGGYYYYNRGGSPGAHCINVGATSANINDSKATFSNKGPGVDIFAPGYNIQSSTHSDIKDVADPRNSNYGLQKLNGTSMSGPQVTGYIACQVQNNTSWAQTDALNFVISNAKTGQMYDAGNATGVDYYSLQGAPNRYLAWPGNNAPGDTTPPTISSTTPANGATGVSISDNISIIFSEAVDSTTINSTNITFGVSGSWSLSGTTATFNPGVNLANNTAYTMTVGTGVTDLVGNALANAYQFSFTTIAAGDTTPPTISSTTPANGATGVSVSDNIIVVFSEAMDATTINSSNIIFQITSGSTVNGTWGLNGAIATFNPSSNLNNNTSYTMTLYAGLKDIAGNNLSTAYQFSFTTAAAADTTPPTVTAVQPTGTGASITAQPGASFSEAMDQNSFTTSTVILQQGSTNVSGSIQSTSTGVNIIPSSNLLNSTTYTATITTGVQDVAGNNMANNYVWNFTTSAAADTTPPTISTTTPANGATGVSVGNSIQVVFSEAMQTSTINSSNITFQTSNGTTVSGTWGYSGTTATFNQSSALSYSTSYTMVVGTGVTDLAGNALANAYTFSFTTQAASGGGDTGYTFPKTTLGTRGASGFIYPRTIIKYP